MKWLSLFIMFVFLLGCSEDDTETTDIKSTDDSKDKTTEQVKKYKMWNQVVSSVFPAEIIKRSVLSNDELFVRLGVPNVQSKEDYFGVNDRLNKILAVDAFSLFYHIPKMNSIDLLINAKSGNYHLKMEKSEIEDYYNLDLDDLREYNDDGELITGDKYKIQFLDVYDNKEERKKFVDKFVK